MGVVGEKDTAVPLRRALEVAQLWMLTSGVATKADDPHSNTPLGNFAAWACFSEQRVSVRQDSQRDWTPWRHIRTDGSAYVPE